VLIKTVVHMCVWHCMCVCCCCSWDQVVLFWWFRWYSLKAKPGSKKADQNRGELEVTATFLVQQNISQSQSSLSIEKKTKKSLSVRNLAQTFSKGILVACLLLLLLYYYYCYYYYIYTVSHKNAPKLFW